MQLLPYSCPLSELSLSAELKGTGEWTGPRNELVPLSPPGYTGHMMTTNHWLASVHSQQSCDQTEAKGPHVLTILIGLTVMDWWALIGQFSCEWQVWVCLLSSAGSSVVGVPWSSSHLLWWQNHLDTSRTNVSRIYSSHQSNNITLISEIWYSCVLLFPKSILLNKFISLRIIIILHIQQKKYILNYYMCMYRTIIVIKNLI